jgi:hypothetical protein
MRTYFYHQGPVSMEISPGVATIVAGRGIESRAVRLFSDIQQDTSIVLTIPRVYDLRSLRWFGGDTHTHMAHVPIEYVMTPAQMHEIAQAEDLSMTWILDNAYNFTGGPDTTSTPDAIMYYTTEYRNQTYGHAALLGLRNVIGFGCCGVPAAAYPMLSDTREAWNPSWDQAMTLAHPCDGADFFDDQPGWPSAGLAREVPVQAASGNLEIYDIVAYSNVGDVALDDWYRLLNCGYHIPPGAGTDAIMSLYGTRPIGGYRIYVKETSATHNPADWVRGLKAGHCFVTNYPLIPEFTIGSQSAGSTIDRPGPSTVVSVHCVVESVLPVATAKIIVNGEVALTYAVPGSPDGSYRVIDTQLTLNESSWIAVRVDGVTDLPHAVSSSLFAHTGPVYVRLDRREAERTIAAGYFHDWCDSLQIFVENRGSWPSQEARSHVLQRIQDTRVAFGSHFRNAPSAFSLLTPADGETLVAETPALFDWTDATFSEPGDRIWYRLAISADTSFAGGYLSPLLNGSQHLLQVVLPGDRRYWWRVVAQEMGEHTSLSTPARQWFYLQGDVTGVNSPEAGGMSGSVPPPRLSVWPNPATDHVHFQWSQPARGPGAFEVFDTGGRIIFRIGSSVSSAFPANPDGCPSSCPGGEWSGVDAAGRPLPSGLYWVRYVPAGSTGATGVAAGSLRARFLLLR